MLRLDYFKISLIPNRHFLLRSCDRALVVDWLGSVILNCTLDRTVRKRNNKSINTPKAGWMM